MKNNDFHDIYNQYYQMLYLYAFSLTKNKDDALDLVNDTFIKAYLHFENTDNSIQYWLVKVLRNLYIDFIRKKKKLINYEIHFEWVEDPYDFTKKIIDNERAAWLYSEILKLPFVSRQVMLFSLELNDEEIAKLLDKSVESIRMIRYRTKKELKEKARKENRI